MNNKDNPLKSFMNEELLYKKLTMDNYEFIKLAFTLAEKTLNSTAIDVINSGTTCLLVIIVNNYLITANVGDSRAIMIQDNNAVSLTIDHKPDLPLEMERIIKRGGEVSKEEGKE